MARCAAVRRTLTAWIDGELRARQHERIRRHVATCAACAAEADSLRATIAWQTRALQAVTAIDELAVEPLWTHLEDGMRARPAARDWGLSSPGPPLWARLFRPIAVGGAALATAIILFLVLAGDPGTILISLGVESPPPAVARQAELFKDYPLIQHLDALEHFDTVQSVPLDDERGSHRG
jgi:anti-sigma factor RsiW